MSSPIRAGVSSTPLWLRNSDLPLMGGGESAGRRSGAGGPKVSHSRTAEMLTPARVRRSAPAGLAICVTPPPPAGIGVSTHGKAWSAGAGASGLWQDFGAGVGARSLSYAFSSRAACTLASSTKAR